MEAVIDKQYRVRLEVDLVEKALKKFERPLTLLLKELLVEYNRNKNLRNKISKKI